APIELVPVAGGCRIASGPLSTRKIRRASHRRWPPPSECTGESRARCSQRSRQDSCERLYQRVAQPREQTDPALSRSATCYQDSLPETKRPPTKTASTLAE